MQGKYLILVGLVSLTLACTPEKESRGELEVSSSYADIDNPTQEVNITKPEKVTQEAMSHLQWTHHFNVKDEIERAIKDADFRLFVVSGRGTKVPGIELESQDSLKKMCGEKYIKGIGDLLFGDEHRELYRKAVHLISEYNIAMAENCKKAFNK